LNISEKEVWNEIGKLKLPDYILKQSPKKEKI